MKKMNFNLLLKNKNILFVFIFLIVFSMIGGVMFAQNSVVPSMPAIISIIPSSCSSSVPNITITWSTVLPPTGITDPIMYKIFRNTSTNSIASSLNSPYYIDNAVVPLTQYSYMVAAYYMSNGTEVSSALSPMSPIVAAPIFCNTPPPSTTPAAPTNLTVTPSSCTSSTPHINITWSTVPPPTGVTDTILYKVFRNTDTTPLVSNLNNPYFVDSAVTTLTPYSYKVIAYYMNNGTEVSGLSSPVSSTASAPVSCNTPPPSTTPSAPTNLIVSPSSCSSTTPHINITWSSVPQPIGVTANIMYKVFRNTDTTPLISNLTGPYYFDGAVTTLTPYSYKVIAYYMNNGTEISSGLSAVSSSVSVPVSCNTPPPGTAPSVPTNVIATPSSCTSSTPHINITWSTVPPPTGVTATIKYRVFRATSTNPIASGLTNPYYLDNTVTTQTQYSYMIKSYYTDNGIELSSPLSPASTAVSVPVSCNTPPPSTAPAVPTNLTVSSSSCTSSIPHINISWSIVLPPTGVTETILYKVFRNTDTTPLISNLTNPYYVDSAVTTLTPYSYKVIAYYMNNGAEISSGLSPVSLSVSAPASCSTSTPIPTPPVTGTIPFAPSHLSFNSISTPHFISIYWVDNSNNEDKFNIQKKLNNETTWHNLSQVDADTTNFIDTTGFPGIRYDYRVQACLSGTGCSSYTSLFGVLIESGVNTTTTNYSIPTTNEQSQTLTTQQIQTTTTTQPTQPIPSTIIPSPEQTNQTEPTVDTSQTDKLAATVPATDFSAKVQDIGLAVKELKTAADTSKEQIVRTINESVIAIINSANLSGQVIDVNKINNLRDQLLEKVDLVLSTSVTITPADINNLNAEIEKGINDIKLVASEKVTTVQVENVSLINIIKTLSSLSETVNSQSVALKAQGGDLLYKDSNNDGISDYESVNVYHMDPIAPSPVSTYNGKTINASEKIILGLDPTKAEIVKVTKEQPIEAKAPIVSTYKVNNVSLTEKKKVIFKGQALPNSFVTIYIYSTPVMVTVKTDSNGEWVYVLDKELENGDHTVYTATVNNSGNIIAKSTGFLFTKTAEAASLKDVPVAEASTNINQPGFFEGNNIYVVAMLVFAAIVLILILIGLTSKRNREKIEKEEAERHVFH